MDSMKTYLVVWLSGMIAGLVLVLRWQHLGSQSLSATANVAEGAATDAATAAAPDSAAKPKTSTVIVTGAKADVERARQLLDKVTPWAKTVAPSPAD